MKSIKLTDSQKSKLLEMCEALFPEYTIYEVQKANHFGRIVNTVQGNKWEYNGDDDEPIDEFFIHWFEFCIIEIVNELAWRNIKTDILADCEYEDFRMKLITEIFRDKFTTEKFHIVDYLYEEFKKLK